MGICFVPCLERPLGMDECTAAVLSALPFFSIEIYLIFLCVSVCEVQESQ